MTHLQTKAIEIILAKHGVERAERACDLGEAERGLYDDEDEILAYGVLPNTNTVGWYFAGYAGEIVRAEGYNV